MSRLSLQLQALLPHQTADLERFYTPTGDEDAAWRNSLLLMQQLVRELKQLSAPTTMQYALQLTNLHLYIPDQSGHATINAWNDHYTIQCPLPPYLNLWEDARIIGHTPDATTAITMILQAITFSGTLHIEDENTNKLSDS